MDLPAPAHELPVRIDGGASGLSIDDERLGRSAGM